MSRAGAAKGAKGQAKPAAPQTPVSTTEIVPGKFNESDWTAMIERDNAEEFIFDIVDEILANTMDAIYKLYIERQLLPFTIAQAKDAILQIIEWQFLARDTGEEGVVESQWIQDEEPDVVVTDCWAQGSVPKTEIAMPTPIPEEEFEEEKCGVVCTDPMVVGLGLDKEPEPELEDKVSDAEDAVEAKSRQDKAAAVVNNEESKKAQKKTQFKPYRGKLKSAGVSKITESLDETEMKLCMEDMAGRVKQVEVSSNLLTMPASCASILKVQSGRPPGIKDVVYDEFGNVTAVVRLDNDKLPNHRVLVKYTVVDPSVEAAQTRLDAMRRGHKQLSGKHPDKVKRKLMVSDNTVSGGKQLQKTRKPIINPLPPSLLETIDVAAGVIVTEAGRTKKGPGRHVKKSDVLEQRQKDLQPVTIKINSTKISVADLLDRDTPILRPIDETRPLPPINSTIKT